jgi:hypothetical protein
MRSKSGNPLKNSPKKPSRSPGTNHRADWGWFEPEVMVLTLKRSRISSRFLFLALVQNTHRNSSFLRNSQEDTTAEPVGWPGFFLCLASRFCIAVVMVFALEG